MENGKNLPEMIVNKMTKKRFMAGSDADDDPPILYDDDGYDDDEGINSYQKGKQLPQPSKSTSDTRCTRFLKFLTTLTVEPFMFIYMFSFMLHAVCQQTLLMEKCCRHELNQSESICSNLSAYEDVKAQVEKIASNYSLYSSLIRFIPGTFVVIYVGSWSDKYGRKPPILLALAGVILEDIGLVLNAVYYEAPIWYFLLASIPSGLTGGFICVLSTTYTLATELTTERFRTIKFALVELGMGLGMTLGTLAGGIMSKYYSYIAIFSISVIGHSLAVPWVLLAIAETRGLSSTANWKKKLREFFTIKHVVEGFLASLKKRPDYGRCQIWLLMASICGIIVTYIALADISFLYTYHRYGWDNAKYSSVSTVFSVFGIIVSLFCIPLFMKVFKMTDPVLGLTGAVSMLIKNLFTAFASKPWLYYAGSAFGLFAGIAPLAVRSGLSKLLHEDELGKVFAFVAAFESLVPVIGSLIITRLYNATVKTTPGAAFLLASALLLPAIGTFLWLRLRKPSPGQLLPAKGQIQTEIVQNAPPDPKC